MIKHFKNLLLFFILGLLIALESLWILSKSDPVGVNLFIALLIFCFSLFHYFLVLVTSKNKFLPSFITSASIVFLLFSFKLSLYPYLTRYGLELVFIALGMILFIFYFLKFQKSFLYLTKVRIVVVLILVSPIILDIFSYNSKPQNNLNLENIKLVNRPNIYLLAFDSLIPPALAKKNIKNHNFKYIDFLNDNFFSFSKGVNLQVPTWHALNAVMRLDQQDYHRIGGYFEGLEPSPLSIIAKNNGYKITAAYETNGAPPSIKMEGVSSHIEKMITPEGFDLEVSTLCRDLGDNTLLSWRLFGACDILKFLKEDYTGVFSIFLDSPPNNWYDTISNSIIDIKKSEPGIGFFYTYNPWGHTSSSYNHLNSDNRESFKQQFLASDSHFVNYMGKLRKTILSIDPNSIVVVFGDHGVWLSRGMTVDNNDPYFIYTDRHKVEIAVMQTKNNCSKKSELQKIDREFVTPSIVLMGIFDCLMDYQTPLASSILLPNIGSHEDILKYIQ
jgi:hypothetical protein